MIRWRVEQGDCLDRLRALPDASVASVVTDPPYGLAFMGKRWDHGVPGVEFWTEALRVAKPGAHLLAFGGTRTYHRLTCAIEDAGWEIRDCVMWVYGSGFPKSHDVSKALDKAAGAERKVIAQKQVSNAGLGNGNLVGGKVQAGLIDVTAPATDAARQWSGWGTALKPAWEPIIVARKPLAGTVAENVLRHGTGGINVDGCRIAATDNYTENAVTQGINTAQTSYAPAGVRRTFEPSSSGRWPANLIHDGSDEVVRLMSDADRFFYCAKASKAERGEDNRHPTVKPIDLMRYLCRLVTPPDGLVLDPFTGSGSTGCAALLEGFCFHGIEREPEYVAIATARITHWASQADAVQVPLEL